MAEIMLQHRKEMLHDSTSDVLSCRTDISSNCLQSNLSLKNETVKKPSPVAFKKLVLKIKQNDVQDGLSKENLSKDNLAEEIRNLKIKESVQEQNVNLKEKEPHITNASAPPKTTSEIPKPAETNYVPKTSERDSGLVAVSKVANDYTPNSIAHYPALGDKEKLKSDIESTVLKRGWLYKKGKSFFPFWHPRWAVLKQVLPESIRIEPAVSPTHLTIHDKNTASTTVPPTHAKDANTSSEKDTLTPAVLEIYDDRFVEESQGKPKHSYNIGGQVGVKLREDGQKYYFELFQAKHSKSKDVKQESKETGLAQFYTCSKLEQEGWKDWIDLVKDPKWLSKKVKRSKERISDLNMKSNNVKQPIPSAPFLDAEVEKNDKKLPIKIEIPAQHQKTELSVEQNNNKPEASGITIGYESSVVLDDSTLENLLKIQADEDNFRADVNCCTNTNINTDYKSFFRNTDWLTVVEGFQQAEQGFTGVPLLEKRVRDGYYVKLGQFRSYSMRWLKDTLDDVSTVNQALSIRGTVYKGNSAFQLGQVNLMFYLEMNSKENMIINNNEVFINIEQANQIKASSPLWIKLWYKGFCVLIYVQPRNHLFSSAIPTTIQNTISLDNPTSLESETEFEKKFLAVAKKLDGLQVYLWEPCLLREYLRVHCIPLKYLGTLYTMCHLPHTRDLLLLAMLARSFKRRLRSKLRERYFFYCEMKAQSVDQGLERLALAELKACISDPVTYIHEDLVLFYFNSQRQEKAFKDNAVSITLSTNGNLSSKPISSNKKDTRDVSSVTSVLKRELAELDKEKIWIWCQWSCGVVVHEPSHNAAKNIALLSSKHTMLASIISPNSDTSQNDILSRVSFLVQDSASSIQVPYVYPYFRWMNAEGGLDGLGLFSVFSKDPIRKLQRFMSPLLDRQTNFASKDDDYTTTARLNEGDTYASQLLNDSPIYPNYYENIFKMPPTGIYKNCFTENDAQLLLRNPMLLATISLQYSLLFPLAPKANTAFINSMLYTESTDKRRGLIWIFCITLSWFFSLARLMEKIYSSSQSSPGTDSLHLSLIKEFSEYNVLHKRVGMLIEFGEKFSGQDIILRAHFSILKIQFSLLTLRNSSIKIPSTKEPLDAELLPIEKAKIQHLMNSLYEELVQVLKSKDHPMIAKFYQVLAATLSFQDSSLHYSKAEFFQNQLSTRYQQLLTANTFGSCMDWQQRAYHVAIASLGKNHGYTLRSQLTLACYALTEENYDLAYSTLQDLVTQCDQTKDIDTKDNYYKDLLTSIPSNINVNSSIVNSYHLGNLFIADVYFAMSETLLIKGDVEKAIFYSLLAKQEKEHHLGADHPHTIQCFYQLGNLCYSVLSIPESLQYPTRVSNLLGLKEWLTRLSTGMTYKAYRESSNFKVNSLNQAYNSKDCLEIALASYQHIFHYLKFQYQSIKAGASLAPCKKVNCESRLSLASDHIEESLSPVKLAYYSVSSWNRSQDQKSTSTDDASQTYYTLRSVNTCDNSIQMMNDEQCVSFQLFDLTRKILHLTLIQLVTAKSSMDSNNLDGKEGTSRMMSIFLATQWIPYLVNLLQQEILTHGLESGVSIERDNRSEEDLYCRALFNSHAQFEQIRKSMLLKLVSYTPQAYFLSLLQQLLVHQDQQGVHSLAVKEFFLLFTLFLL